MQQTTKYKLNLIESSDPFSPEGLNQNAQKVENALIAHEAAVEEVTDGLDQRITVLEAHKLVVGSYVGNGIETGDHQTISLPFTPEAVVVFAGSYSIGGIKEHPSFSLKVVEGGFQVSHSSGGMIPNASSSRYIYIAIL